MEPVVGVLVSDLDTTVRENRSSNWIHQTNVPLETVFIQAQLLEQSINSPSSVRQIPVSAPAVHSTQSPGCPGVRAGTMLLLLVAVCAFQTIKHVHTSESCSELPVFSPSRLVVRYNHSATATCSICNSSCDYKLRLEEPFQSSFSRGKELVWNVSRVTEWDVEPICSIFDSSCTSTLEVIVYKPPERVSLSFREQGPLEEGRSYSVLCEVESVAPAQNMTVVFYRGLRELSVQSSSSDQKSPVNQSFSLDYRVSREDHGAQFWYKPCCEGPAEPQIISVTRGQSVELNCSSEGNPQPVYSWSLPSGASRGHSVLTISSASSEDQGLYTCTAENTLGHVTRSFSLQVHVNVWLILLPVLAVFLLVAVACGLYKYFNTHTGTYRFPKVFRGHRHTPVPTSE
ncbi:hypothetical protein WMY93_006012 [Mugilogobius chulae]|uniref:Ig-like domain-containing protein n=1 Tax=Mugilogobius chulae TaxID=88201 RepID=A0AAW0PIL9_9GOBI